MLKERTKETFEERVEKKLKEKDKAKNKKMKTWKKILIVLLILFILGLSTVGFLLYGPYSGFRDWLITSAMTTLNHQYLATMFYSDETIQNVLANNRVIESNETTDVSLIAINSIEGIVVYENEYEKQILVKDPEHEDYKIINIEGDGYKGYLVAIYDPTKIKVCTTKNLGVSGQYLVRMAQDNNAQLAINGGGFYDPNYNSSGGIPQGTVIQNGKIVSQRNYTRSGGMIGFDADGKLILGKMTAQEALNMGIQEGVTFRSILNCKRRAIRSFRKWWLGASTKNRNRTKSRWNSFNASIRWKNIKISRCRHESLNRNNAKLWSNKCSKLRRGNIFSVSSRW